MARHERSLESRFPSSGILFAGWPPDNREFHPGVVSMDVVTKDGNRTMMETLFLGLPAPSSCHRIGDEENKPTESVCLLAKTTSTNPSPIFKVYHD